MSRFFAFILTAISFSAPAFAQSMLKVKLADNSQFSISVDGRFFNRRGTSITVGDLPAGVHSIRIYSMTSYRDRGYQELYRGRVRTEEGMITNFTYDPYGGNANMQQMAMNQNPNYPNNGYGSRGNGVANNYPENSQRNEAPPAQEPSQQDYTPKTEPEAPVNTAPDVPVVTRDENRPVASPVIVDEGSMTEAKTNKLKTKVSSKKTDTEKLKELKESLQNEKITTYQVSVMMDWFSFESSKLEFAKWAYDITLDKENFEGLGAKFTYKDSEEDLKKFLQSK